MTISKIKKIRLSRFSVQNGQCFYCRQPMWERDPESFAQRYRLTRRQSELLRSTAEHLLPRGEGGPDNAGNIVAACKFCNQHRQYPKVAKPPEIYAQLVQKRLTRQKWHGLQLGGEAR